jgi:hypothetical protein
VKFNQKALNELKWCKENIEKEVPQKIIDNLWLAQKSPKNWFSNFKLSWEVSELSGLPLNRSDLFMLIDQHRNIGELDKPTLRKLIVSVFAWGAMGTSATNGKLAINSIEAYEGVCSELLCGMTPVDAYAEFFKLKKLKKMRGVGPAYYTKLIFFFGDQSGLIMDQWTARSTNLLLGKALIKLVGNYVSDSNSEQVYREYLNFVTELKNHLGINSIAKAEELIFSCPHKHRAVKKRLGKYHGACSAWRKYVAENT